MPSPKMRNALLIACITFITIASCVSGGTNPTPEIIPSTTPLPTETASPQSSETQAPMTLSIWLPPRQSPYEDSPAGDLFSDRLSDFEESHPSIKIEVRVKETEGVSGLFESLLTTSTAAPSALPDIIVLHPKALLQSASAGLVKPLESLLESSETSNWYDHTEASSVVNDELMGIPFVSETDLFIYRSDTYPEAPTTWAALITGDETYLFPAGDKSARFTFAQYVNLGGVLEGEGGDPQLDGELTQQILSFYLSSRESGYLPLAALQLVSAEEVFSALNQDGADGAVISLASYLHQTSRSQYAAIPLPTKDGNGIVFTETYAWSIVTPDLERQFASAELIRWLMEPDFLGEWAFELGMLPATSSALAAWPDPGTAALVNRLIRAAAPLPDFDTLDQFGPAMQTAIEEVLFGRKSPQEAAEELQELVITP